MVLLTAETRSQNAIADSLKTELNQAKSDTAKIRYTIDLAIHLSGIAPDTAHLLCQQASVLTRQLADSQIRTSALSLVGKGYKAIRQLDSALLFFRQAQQLALENNDKRLLAEVLNNLGSTYRGKNDLQQALNYYLQSLEAHKAIGNKSGQTAALNNIGIIHTNNGDFDTGLRYYAQALQLQQETGNKESQAAILQNIGLIYGQQNQLEKSISHYHQALELRRELGQVAAEATLLSLIGTTYRRHGNFTGALEVYQQALKIMEELGDKKLMSRTLMRIGNLYNSLKDHRKGIDYLQRCLALREELDDIPGQAGVLNNIGRTFMLKGEYDQALQHLHRSLRLRREVGPRTSESYPLYNIGSTYEKLNRLDSAYFYLRESIGLSRKYNNQYLETLCLTDLSRIYWKRGEVSEAVANLEAAWSLSPEDALPTEKVEVAALLYQIHKEQGNYQLALYYHEKHHALLDSLFNEENTKKITLMEAEYGFEKEKQRLAYEKEKELFLIDEKLRRQQFFQIAMALALLIALVLIFVIARYYRLKQRSNEELRRLNDEILQQKEQLEELDGVKSRFFTNISHEFRTPLTVISGMVEQIKKSPHNGLEKGLKMIKRNSACLLHLVNQILDLRKLETGGLRLNLILGDIVFYLRYIAESFHSLAENKEIKLHFRTNEPELLMDYDKDKILCIVSNLLSNAIKFTSEGGEVHFLIGKEAAKPTPMLVLQIRDTGVGISEEKLPDIFDRFYQVDDSNTRSAEGAGIGLSLTRELVKLMGGDISVVSKLGEGTTFHIRLPIRHTAAFDDKLADKIQIDNIDTIVSAVAANVSSHHHSHETMPKIADGMAERVTVLIIEDNADLVQYLTSMLQDDSRVVVACDGQEGINKAIEQIPHLIISDVMMPNQDGFEVCEILKKDQRTSHIPIIMLTAKADDDSRITGFKKGADAYLSKPFNQKELLVRLEKLLEIRRQLQARYQNLDLSTASEDLAVRQEDTFISKVKKIMEANLSNDGFGIPELCQELGMSRSQLHLKIKALTNRSTTHFIRLIRLHKAKELLQTSDLNITQIAYEVGFRDPSYFTRTFTEEFNLSPREFVKN